MSEKLKEISYETANSLLFVNDDKQDTHVFSGSIGCCWKTEELRELMRKSKLYFRPRPYMFGGHQVIAETPDGRILNLETADEKVKKYLGETP